VLSVVINRRKTCRIVGDEIEKLFGGRVCEFGLKNQDLSRKSLFWCCWNSSEFLEHKHVLFSFLYIMFRVLVFYKGFKKRGIGDKGWCMAVGRWVIRGIINRLWRTTSPGGGEGSLIK